MTSWTEQALKAEEPVLSWSSKSNILNYEGQAVTFHTVDRQILMISDSAVSQGKTVAIVYPVRRAEVAVPICIEACYLLLERGRTDRGSVLLVSNSLDLRGLYGGIKANYMHLNSVFPLRVVKTSGSIRAGIKTGRGSSAYTAGEFLHTSNVRILPNEEVSKRIGCAVIETAHLSPRDVDKTLDWAEEEGVPATIILETDPYSANLQTYERRGIPIWGWNSGALASDFSEEANTISVGSHTSHPFARSGNQILNWLKGVSREFITVGDETINHHLQELLNLYLEVKQTESLYSGDALQKVCSLVIGLKASIERMVGPAEQTETACRLSFLAKSVADRITESKRFAELLDRRDDPLAGLLRRGAIITESALEYLKKSGNPKHREAMRIIRESLSDSQSLLIVSYNEPYSEALSKSASQELNMSVEELELRGIDFVSLKQKYVNKEYDRCLLFGRMPYRDSWILRVAWAPNMVLLLYPTEKAILKSQFEQEERRYNDLFSDTRREEFLRNLSGKENLPIKQHSPIRGTNVFPLTLTESEQEQAAEIRPLLTAAWKEESFDEQEEMTYGEEPTEYHAVTEAGDVLVKAVKAILQESMSISFRPGSDVPVYANRNLKHVQASTLQPGDTLILIRGGVRQDFADYILERTDNHPRMQEITMRTKLWVSVLRSGMNSANDSIGDFLAKLQAAQEQEGVRVTQTYATARQWVKGLTIGPRDGVNIKLIGKIYGSEALIRDYLKINEAARRMRGLHRSILRRMDDILLKAGMRNRKGASDDEVIDEEFNLHVSDFAGVLTLEQIEQVIPDAIVPAANINKKMEAD